MMYRIQYRRESGYCWIVRQTDEENKPKQGACMHRIIEVRLSSVVRPSRFGLAVYYSTPVCQPTPRPFEASRYVSEPFPHDELKREERRETLAGDDHGVGCPPMM